MTIICCREGWLGLESVLQLLGWPLHCSPPLLLADCSYSGHWADLCLQVLGSAVLCWNLAAAAQPAPQHRPAVPGRLSGLQSGLLQPG